MRALRVVGITEDGDGRPRGPGSARALHSAGRRAAARCRAGRSVPARPDRDRVGEPVASTRDPGPHPRRSVRGAGGHGSGRAGAEDRAVRLPGADGTLPDRGQRPARPPDARRRPGQPHARRGRRAHLRAARPGPTRGAKWDSWKGEDGRWVVALRWRAGRSDNRAHWVFQPGAHGGTVTALDEHASDLVEGLPARPLRTVGAVIDMARPEEEPPPTPSPVEQWRAGRVRQLPRADAVRPRPGTDHEPHPVRAVAPGAAGAATDRGSGRTCRHLPADGTDPRSPSRGATRPVPVGRSRSPTRVRRPRGRTPSRRRPRRTGAQTGRTAEWAPWERGVNRSGVSTAPAPSATSAPGDQVTVPAARTAVPTPPAPADEVTVADDTPPAETADAAAPARSPPRPRSHRSRRSSKRRPAAAARITSAAAPAAPEPEPEQAAASRTPPTRRSPRRARRPRAKRRRTSRRAQPSRPRPRQLRSPSPPRPPSLRSRRRPPRRSAPARASR